MNRCLASPLRRCAARAALAFGLSAFCTLSIGQATGRPIPQDAAHGLMQITQPPQMLLNGAPARLAPGARIHDTNHMLVMSAVLVQQQFLVRYVLDAQAQVAEVWIEGRPGPAPARARAQVE